VKCHVVSLPETLRSDEELDALGRLEPLDRCHAVC
jgi:hypothetical protein